MTFARFLASFLVLLVVSATHANASVEKLMREIQVRYEYLYDHWDWDDSAGGAHAGSYPQDGFYDNGTSVARLQAVGDLREAFRGLLKYFVHESWQQMDQPPYIGPRSFQESDFPDVFGTFAKPADTSRVLVALEAAIPRLRYVFGSGGWNFEGATYGSATGYAIHWDGCLLDPDCLCDNSDWQHACAETFRQMDENYTSVPNIIAAAPFRTESVGEDGFICRNGYSSSSWQRLLKSATARPTAAGGVFPGQAHIYLHVQRALEFNDNLQEWVGAEGVGMPITLAGVYDNGYGLIGTSDVSTQNYVGSMIGNTSFGCSLCCASEEAEWFLRSWRVVNPSVPVVIIDAKFPASGDVIEPVQPACINAGPLAVIPKLGSVHLDLTLGRGAYGEGDANFTFEAMSLQTNAALISNFGVVSVPNSAGGTWGTQTNSSDPNTRVLISPYVNAHYDIVRLTQNTTTKTCRADFYLWNSFGTSWPFTPSAAPYRSLNIEYFSSMSTVDFFGAGGAISVPMLQVTTTLEDFVPRVVRYYQHPSGWEMAEGVNASTGVALRRTFTSVVLSSNRTLRTTTAWITEDDRQLIRHKEIRVEELIDGVMRETAHHTFADPAAQLGNPSQAEGILTTTRTYNEKGLVATTREANGNWQHVSYDSNGNPSEIVRQFLDGWLSLDSNGNPTDACRKRNEVTIIERPPAPTVDLSGQQLWWGTRHFYGAFSVPVNVVRTTTFVPNANLDAWPSVPVHQDWDVLFWNAEEAYAVSTEVRWKIEKSTISTATAASEVASVLQAALTGNGGIPYAGLDRITVTRLDTSGYSGSWLMSNRLSPSGELTTVTEGMEFINSVWRFARRENRGRASEASGSDFLAKTVNGQLKTEFKSEDRMATVETWDSQGVHDAKTLILQRSVESSPDSVGRATRIDYLGGTFTTMSQTCCGASTKTDPDGTVHNFSFDVLGRKTSEEVSTYTDGTGAPTITTKYSYDAADNITEIRRLPSGANQSEVLIERSAFDAARRIIEHVANGVVRTIEYENIIGVNGSGEPSRILRNQVITSMPQVSVVGTPNAVIPQTVESKHPDGRSDAITGNAAKPTRFKYLREAPDTGQSARVLLTEQVIRLNGAEQETNEWTKRFVDELGRTEKERFSDSAETRFYYGVRDQLVRKDDPDGVRTLYTNGWDAFTKVNYEITAIDITASTDTSRNGQIDYGGNDRITKVERKVMVLDSAASVKNGTRTTVSQLIDNSDTVWVPMTTEDVYSDDNKIVSRKGNVSSVVFEKVITTYDPANKKRTVTTTDYGSTVTSTEYGKKVLESVYRAGKLVTERTLNSTTEILKRTLAYDSHGRLASSTDLDPTGGSNAPTTTYAYTPFASGNNPSVDRVASITQSPVSGANGNQITGFEYDALGRTTLVKLPDDDPVHSSLKRISTGYDAAGNVASVRGARTLPIDYTYDTQGRLLTMTTYQSFTGGTPGTPAVTKWNYNPYRGWLDEKQYANTDSGANGDPLTASGPTYTHTPSGKLASRAWRRTLPASSTRITTSYSYGEAGDLIAVAYNDLTTPDLAYSYDRRGLLSSVVDQAGTRGFTYDSLDVVAKEEFNAGTFNHIKFEQEFDFEHRRTKLKYSNSTTDLGTNGYAYDAISRLNRIWRGRYLVGYAYEAKGSRVESHTIRDLTSSPTSPPNIGDGTAKASGSRTYDGLGRQTSLYWRDGGATSGTYIQKYDYTYNAASQRDSLAVTGASDRPDFTWSYGYDTFGQLSSAGKTWNSTSESALGQQFAYTFDAIGNRTQTKITEPGASSLDRVWNYTPNRLNQYTQNDGPRLLDVMGFTTSSSVNLFYSNSSTALAGTLQPTASGGAASGPFYRILPNWGGTGIVGEIGTVNNVDTPLFLPPKPETYSYDADGNLTSDGRFAYGWDAENRLIRVEMAAVIPSAPGLGFDGVWQYEYDFLGRRVRKYRAVVPMENMMSSTETGGDEPGGGETNGLGGGGEQNTIVDETRFLYDGWQLTAELGGNNAVKRTYVYGPDLSNTLHGAGGIGGMVLQIDGAASSSTNTRWACFDPQGNITDLRAVADNTRWAGVTYGPFGEIITAKQNLDKFTLRFSGKYFDDETGLSYVGLRYYNANTGRWMNRDPRGESGGANCYAMVGNAVTGLVDPLGDKPRLYTFSGINVGSAYVGEALKERGVTSDWDWFSKISISQWTPWTLLNTETTLNEEAWRESMRIFPFGEYTHPYGPTDGTRCDKKKNIYVLMLAPKTQLRPSSYGCNLIFEVVWSPLDIVPNQFAGNPNDANYWEGWGTVHTVNPELVTGDSDWNLWNLIEGDRPSHALEPYLNPALPEVRMEQVTLAVAGHIGVKTSWVPTGRKVDVMGILRRKLASAQLDYIFVCHSQGCNMAMYSLDRVCADW